MNAQRFVLPALAALALVAGLTTSWWRLGPKPPHSDAVSTLFAQRYVNLTGTVQPLSDWRGKWLVVNFWAPWCAPCVEEMPALQEVRDEFQHRNMEVLGLGIDSAANISAFAQQHHIRFPLYAAGSAGVTLAQTLGNSARALPYTVLITPEGTIAQQKLGQIKPEELRQWLAAQSLRP